MIPTYNQTMCMNHIPHCNVTGNGMEEAYFVKDEKYQCAICDHDHYWDVEKEVCARCDMVIPGCNQCSSNAA
jgi:hypothetical protein